MVRLNPNAEELVRTGQSFYDAKLRPEMERAHPGEYLILNVDTGEYEVDPDDAAASRRARARFAGANLLTLRIGRPTAFQLGGGRLRAQ